MTTCFKLASRLFFAVGLAGLSVSAIAASDTASATAVVLAPMTATKAADLVFGSVVAGNGVVTIATDGTRTKSGTTALPSFGSATPSAARFDITGTGAQTFSISYSGSLTLTSVAADTMTMALISESLSGATPTATGLATPSTVATGTLASGLASIFVGAALTVGAAQPAGTYTGSVVVTVDYN